MNRLEELILAGQIDEALDHVAQMNVDHIRSLLQYETMEEAPERFDLFLRRLYESADSPYKRGEIDSKFSGLYLISPLCYLENWEFTVRDLGLSALSGLAKTMADDIAELDLLVGSPNSPIAAATHERLMGYARQLRAMDFQPTAEERSVHESEVTEEFEKIGENTEEWVEQYRRNQFHHANSDSSRRSTTQLAETQQGFWERFSIFKRKSKHG